MNSEQSLHTAFCANYERLLHECQRAQDIWAEWRHEMNALAVINRINKQAAEELLRLQANFAKAYARLEKHNRECELCQFVAKLTKEQRCLRTVPDGVSQSWLA